MVNNYSELLYEELRAMLLNNELEHEYMTEEDYSHLLDYETELDDPSNIVLNFCFDGLSRFDKYKDCDNINIDIKSLAKIHDKGNFKFSKNIRRVSIAVIAVISSFFVITVTAAALGYNVIELALKALNTQEKTATDNDGNEIILTDNTRFYSSMNEMLNTENLKILYPEKLPDNYKFTDFRVDDFNNRLEIMAFATEPYISFEVIVKANYDIEDNYSYKINDIEYNTVVMDNGMFQAYWSDGENYYTIVVSEEAILSDIIKNLKES